MLSLKRFTNKIKRVCKLLIEAENEKTQAGNALRIKKIRISCSLAPDVIDYLNSRNDKPKAQVIEDAIRVLKLYTPTV